MAEQVIVTRFEANLQGLNEGVNQYEKQLGRVDKAEKDTAKSTKDLTAATGSLGAKYKVAQGQADAAAKAQQNVGDATKEAAGAVKGQLSGTFPVIGRFKDLMVTVGRAVYLALGPVGIAIGLVVAALGALVSIFAGTQEGADRLNSVLQPLKAIFQALIGVAQQAGKAIVDTFTNPKQAVLDLWEFIKENIVNRFTGLVDTFKALGTVLQGVFELDLDKVNAGAAALGESVVQSLTGIDDLAGKAGAAIDSLGKVVGDAAEKGKRLAQIKVELEELAIRQAQQEGDLRLELEQQTSLAKDLGASSAEREKAGARAIAAQRQLTQLETDKIDLQAEELRIRQTLNDTSREEEADLARLVSSKKVALAAEEAGNRRLQTTLIGLRVQEGKAAEASAAKAKAATDKLAEDQIKASAKVQEAQAAIADEALRRTLSDNEIAELDVAQRYEKQVATAKAAFAELAALSPESEQVSIAEAQAEALVAIEANKQAELQLLRDEDAEALRVGLQSEADAQKEAINVRYEELKALAERTIEDKVLLGERLLEIEAQQSEALREVKTEQDELEAERLKKKQEDEQALVQVAADGLQQITAAAATGQIKTAEQAGKAILSIALEVAEKQALLAIANATVQSLATPQSAATGGTLGLAQAAVLAALIKGVMAALRGALSGAYEGERLIGAGSERPVWSGRDGYIRKVHKNEGIIDAKTNTRYLSYIDMMRDGTFDNLITERPVRNGRDEFTKTIHKTEGAINTKTNNHYLPYLSMMRDGTFDNWITTISTVNKQSESHSSSSHSSANNSSLNFNDRKIVGALGTVGSIKEQEKQTLILATLSRDLKRRPSKRYIA